MKFRIRWIQVLVGLLALGGALLGGCGRPAIGLAPAAPSSHPAGEPASSKSGGEKQELSSLARDIEVQPLPADPLPTDLAAQDILLTNGFTIARDRLSNHGSHGVRVWLSTSKTKVRLDSGISVGNFVHPGERQVFAASVELWLDEVDVIHQKKASKIRLEGGFIDLKAGEQVDLEWKIHAPEQVGLCVIQPGGFDRRVDRSSIVLQFDRELKVSEPSISRLEDAAEVLLSERGKDVSRASGDWSIPAQALQYAPWNIGCLFRHEFSTNHYQKSVLL
jgi:hypothetical protein